MSTFWQRWLVQDFRIGWRVFENPRLGTDSLSRLTVLTRYALNIFTEVVSDYD